MLEPDTVINLRDQLRARTCIPFCGAGISAAAGLPTVAHLLAECAVDSQKWPNAVSEIEARNPAALRRFLERIREAKTPHDHHRYLARLDAQYYITTNFDLLLECAFDELYGTELTRHFRAFRSPRDMPGLFAVRNCCIKLHGDVTREREFVLRNTDYLRRLRYPTHMDKFVEVLMLTNTVLFVGYSLADDNIRTMLEDVAQTDSGSPRKFIILARFEREQWREDWLRRHNVEPIYLECDEPKWHEAALTAFLRTLWEQKLHFHFTKMHKAQDPRDLLQQGLAARQRGDFAEAVRVHEAALEIDWHFHPDCIQDFLYFTVSLHDKLERWEELEHLDRLRHKQLLAKLAKTTPADVVRLINATYAGAMALALLRSGDFERALSHVNEALETEPSGSAAPELHMEYANWLAVRAMARLAQWAHHGASDVIMDADNDLKRAHAIFDQLGMSDSNSESHLMGRYWGTKAFVGLALIEGGSACAPSVEEILDVARRSHDGPNRTSYGRVAGFYCEAYVFYRITSMDADSQGKRHDFSRSRDLIDMALKLTGDGKEIARLKLVALRARIERTANSGDAAFWENQAAELQVTIGNRHPRLAKAIGQGDWLKSPLN